MNKMREALGTDIEKCLAAEEKNKEEIKAEIKTQVDTLTSTVTRDHEKADNIICTVTSDERHKGTNFNPVAEKRASNCAEIKDQGNTRSGVYIISLPDGKDIQMYCDMTTDGGGWTVLQRRADITPHVDFNRGWSDYKKGFGDLEGEFWLGLDNIHSLTSQPSAPVRLRVDLENFQDEVAYAEYKKFIVSNESEQYRLSVGGHIGRGGAGDSLTQHDGHLFSTFDRDNDGYDDSNRADSYRGGWWHRPSTHAFLNGPYHKEEVDNCSAIIWLKWKGTSALKKSEMKIRPYD